MRVSYDAHDPDASHLCDQCKKFVTKKRYAEWQSRFIDNEPDEPLLCDRCG